MSVPLYRIGGIGAIDTTVASALMRRAQVLHWMACTTDSALRTGELLRALGPSTRSISSNRWRPPSALFFQLAQRDMFARDTLLAYVGAASEPKLCWRYDVNHYSVNEAGRVDPHRVAPQAALSSTSVGRKRRLRVVCRRSW